MYWRDKTKIDNFLICVELDDSELDIIRKTHGLMRNDFVWIRFQGENLKYDDIKIR